MRREGAEVGAGRMAAWNGAPGALDMSEGAWPTALLREWAGGGRLDGRKNGSAGASTRLHRFGLAPTLRRPEALCPCIEA